jgi:hypothetical protein
MSPELIVTLLATGRVQARGVQFSPFTAIFRQSLGWMRGMIQLGCDGPGWLR